MSFNQYIMAQQETEVCMDLRDVFSLFIEFFLCLLYLFCYLFFFFFFQAEDGIRDGRVTGVQTCALPILGDDRGNTHPGGRSGDRSVDALAAAKDWLGHSCCCGDGRIALCTHNSADRKSVV